MAERFFSHEDGNFLNYSTCGQVSINPEMGNLAYQQIEPIRTSSRYFGNQSYNVNAKNSNYTLPKYANPGMCWTSITPGGSVGHQNQYGQHNGYLGKHRYAPYSNRPVMYAQPLGMQYQQQFPPMHSNCSSVSVALNRMDPTYMPPNNGAHGPANCSYNSEDKSQAITLQINNLDYTLDENTLRHFLLNQLKPITPVLSLVFEGNSYAKVTVPDITFAKQVVANLHRKKVGHKRLVVSYTRDSSLTEINTLRCQVAGLLKDVPFCTLPMYKFRELFQSRFKTSISVLDLYKMPDICNITTDKNEEKYISLYPDLINSIENSPLMECLQHSVPYCTVHFKREQHKGWAEQDIEPLPNVFMTISEIQQIIYPLLKRHPGDIPIASLLHCISGELGIQIVPNENGVNLEHLICCVHGTQITSNNFGIKILSWLEPESAVGKENSEGRVRSKNGPVVDPLYQISREVVELIKMSPRSTMKFNRFIPAYHNHFGKQCRVADYGYTKLIELFDALSDVVQIMGDGENRLITLTHRKQIRRFTSDLLRVLRSQGNKSVLLSQLPKIFSHTQNRNFDITDYGVCDIVDILDGLVNSNIVVVSTVQNSNDILISIPKRKQTPAELERTSIFAGEVVELFRNAPQYSILFQKFVRSYHYHFGYQCRLNDYGFLKLADLMEAIQGVVEIEFTTDEDKRIYLSPEVARRVFAEQLEELVRESTGHSTTCIKLDDVLQLHKKKFGYQMQSQTLGFKNILEAVKELPYIELLETDNNLWIICHFDDPVFRSRCYRVCKIIQDFKKENISINDLITAYAAKYDETLTEQSILAMKHLVQVNNEIDEKYVNVTHLADFLMNLIRILEQRYMKLSEIKAALNIGLGSCFKFGYPNLLSVIRAFPDIFTVEAGPTQDKSEVGLIVQGDLVTKVPYSIPRLEQNNLPKMDKKQTPMDVTIETQQPLLLHNTNRPSKIIQCAQRKCITNGPVCPSQNFLLHCNNMSMMMNDSTNYNQFNRSLNSSSTSDPNSSCGSINSINGTIENLKLYERRRINLLSEVHDIYEIINSAPAYRRYGPPKPDSPPSDSIPFWNDPIWANSNGENSPKIDSLNINLPEMTSLTILPLLVSPYTLSKTENMKKMFSFEDIDRKIA